MSPAVFDSIDRDEIFEFLEQRTPEELAQDVAFLRRSIEQPNIFNHARRAIIAVRLRVGFQWVEKVCDWLVNALFTIEFEIVGVENA